MRRAALNSPLLMALALSFCGRRGIKTFAAADENSGVIGGTVRYENGNPANDATV
jgi:hypothetical protein